MSQESLDDVPQRAGSAGSVVAQFADRSVRVSGSAIEFTNWRDEQRSWRETCTFSTSLIT